MTDPDTPPPERTMATSKNEPSGRLINHFAHRLVFNSLQSRAASSPTDAVKKETDSRRAPDGQSCGSRTRAISGTARSLHLP